MHKSSKQPKPVRDTRRGIDHIGVSACALVHDGKGNVLLMKRGANARDEHGRWDIMGGAIELGESIDHTLHRELYEELKTKPLEVLFLSAYDAHREYQGQKTHWIALLHAIRVKPDTVSLGEPDKFDEIGWFTSKNLPAPLHSQFHKALQAAQAAGIIT